MLPESVDVIMLVVDIFERLQIPYLIGGSMASAVHGVARSTLDADIVADLQPEQTGAFTAALGEDFYADPEMIAEAVVTRSSFNLIHLKNMFKVDVFILKNRPFDQARLHRRVKQTFSGDPEKTAYLSSAEDIVLAKLEWYRVENEISDRQWRDILGVLNVQAGRLDIGYLRQWASTLGVSDLLERALDESKPE